MSLLIIIDAFQEYSIPEELTEAKGLHSYKTTDEIRQALLNMGFDLDRGQFKDARRQATRSANRDYAALFERVKKGLINTTDRYLKGEILQSRWRTWVKELLKEAYEEAFDLGLRSSGAGKYRVGKTSMDTDWVQTAYRHEMRFFDKLLMEIEASAEPAQWAREPETIIDPKSGKQIRNPRAGKPKLIKPARLSTKSLSIIHRRLTAYADAVKHIYYAGRVMGTPRGMVIHWLSPLDRRTCNGCRFLSNHSPFTRDTLPTTPRAGDTRCLNNCRCRLVMAEVDSTKWSETQRKHHSKRWYKDKLARLKAGHAL